MFGIFVGNDTDRDISCRGYEWHSFQEADALINAILNTRASEFLESDQRVRFNYTFVYKNTCAIKILKTTIFLEGSNGRLGDREAERELLKRCIIETDGHGDRFEIQRHGRENARRHVDCSATIPKGS